MIALTYVSSAISSMSRGDIAALVQEAQRFNQTRGVTGILLYYDGTFFQYLEGEEHEVLEIYERIKHSKRHHGLIKLCTERISRRYFDRWAMHYAELPTTPWQNQQPPDWLKSIQAEDEPPMTISLLLQFWSQTQQVRI